jgi:hypothetical protein
LDWEYEEHKVRLNTLAVSHEIELVRLDTVKREGEFMNQKHELELKLLQNKANEGMVTTEELQGNYNFRIQSD